MREQTAVYPCEQVSSPFLLGDDQDVVEEEEVNLLPRGPLEEDAAVLDEGRQLAALHHPPGGGDQRERLRERRQGRRDLTRERTKRRKHPTL